MDLRHFASTAAVVAAVSLGFGVEGRTHGPTGTFTDVQSLGPEVNSPFFDGLGIPSGDGKTLAFNSDRPGGSGDVDLYIADREDTAEWFTAEEVRNVTELNTGARAFATFVSDDGLTLYFTSNATGDWDMYSATRPSRDDPFEPAQPVEGINGPYLDAALSLTADGLCAYFRSDRPGGRGGGDIWEATRSSVEEPFTVVRNVEEVNTSFTESGISISGDGLTLFWSDNPDFATRPGGSGGADIWCASRASRQERFGPAVNLGSPINTVASDYWIRVHPRWPEDGSIVYFSRCIVCDSGSDIYQATWRLTPPAPRFRRGLCNDDDNVDLSDAVCLLNYLFGGGPVPGCLAATNSNGDEAADISDAAYLLNHLFLGGPAPVAPYPECGPGELAADDALGCEAPPAECAS